MAALTLPLRSLFTFPNPVNETSARLVAGGVGVLTAAASIGRQHWLLPVIAYGFVARVLAGPTLSPLGLLVTRVITPRLSGRHRLVPGPPKRFAQGIGAILSATALVLHFGFGATGAAEITIGLITAAALLESVFGFCLGCVIFGWLMRAGVIPEKICAECADITQRLQAPGS